MNIELNSFFYITIAILVGSFLLNLIANILNSKAISDIIPQEFTNYYDSEKYKKSQDYTTENTKFAIISETFNFIILLTFWLLGGFGIIDNFVRNLHLNTILSGLTYFAILMIANHLISLPFTIYHTFVIEKKYGFNKTTVKTFISDQIKGIILSAILLSILLSVVMAIFMKVGTVAWIYATVISVLFMLFIQAIAPTVIMPLFNKFTPLEGGSLKEKIEAFAQKVAFPLTGLFVIDGSKRSSKSNAFFTGFGKNKRIALFDTLIENHTEEQLVAVLAHEIGHYKKKHILVMMILSIIQTIITFYLFSLFLNNQELSQAFGVSEPTIYTSLVFFSILFTPISTLLSIVTNAISRKNEYEADNFAKENIDNPQDMIDALKKLSVDNLSNVTPHPFYVWLHYSHPTVLQRIERLKH